MDEIRVESWIELHERLFDAAWQEELSRHRSNFAFRGRSDAAERPGRTQPLADAVITCRAASLDPTDEG